MHSGCCLNASAKCVLVNSFLQKVVPSGHEKGRIRIVYETLRGLRPSEAPPVWNELWRCQSSKTNLTANNNKMPTKNEQKCMALSVGLSSCLISGIRSAAAM